MKNNKKKKDFVNSKFFGGTKILKILTRIIRDNVYSKVRSFFSLRKSNILVIVRQSVVEMTLKESAQRLYSESCKENPLSKTVADVSKFELNLLF